MASKKQPSEQEDYVEVIGIFDQYIPEDLAGTSPIPTKQRELLLKRTLILLKKCEEGENERLHQKQTIQILAMEKQQLIKWQQACVNKPIQEQIKEEPPFLSTNDISCPSSCGRHAICILLKKKYGIDFCLSKFFQMASGITEPKKCSEILGQLWEFGFVEVVFYHHFVKGDSLNEVLTTGLTNLKISILVSEKNDPEKDVSETTALTKFVPGNVVPRNVVPDPENVVHEKFVSEKVVHKRVVLENVVTEKTVPKKFATVICGILTYSTDFYSHSVVIWDFDDNNSIKAKMKIFDPQKHAWFPECEARVDMIRYLEVIKITEDEDGPVIRKWLDKCGVKTCETELR